MPPKLASCSSFATDETVVGENLRVLASVSASSFDHKSKLVCKLAMDYNSTWPACWVGLCPGRLEN